MAKVKVYNTAGQVVKDVDVNDDIYSVAVQQSLVHQVVVAQQANARHNFAHTKDRSEVRGGGKKPWRQKGTGRARHGSSRSPIWIGGGVTFGPRKDRNFSKDVNKKMKRKALFMTLTDKLAKEQMVVLDALTVETPKTKDMVQAFAALPVGRKVLVVLPETNENVWKAVRNIPNVKTITANSLNVVDVLNADTLVVPEAALEVIESVYLK
jgi:large subunit ribosomal protein L4